MWHYLSVARPKCYQHKSYCVLKRTLCFPEPLLCKAPHITSQTVALEEIRLMTWHFSPFLHYWLLLKAAYVGSAVWCVTKEVTEYKWCMYDIYHVCALQIKNRSESDLCSYEATKAVVKKAQKILWGSKRIWTHDLHDICEYKPRQNKYLSFF